MTVKLVRQKDTFDLMYNAQHELFDDPRYKYLLSADYVIRLETDSGGWNNDGYCIYHGDKIAGFMIWYIDRTHDSIDGPTVMVLPEFLNTGVGVIAIAKWLLYIFEQRHARRVSFGACSENPAAKIYGRMIDRIGGQIVGRFRKSMKLVDGCFYDSIKYDVLGVDFVPEPLRAIAAKGE